MALRRRRLLSALACVVTSIATGSVTSRAAEPTKAECLGASEAWLNLRKSEKLIEARAQLLLCASTTCPADVRDECALHIPQLNASIPTVVFVAQDASGNDVTAVRVSMDGQPIADRLAGDAIVLDPGQHVFRFEAAGLPPVEKTLVIYRAEKDRRERVVFGAASAAPPHPPHPPPPPSATGSGAVPVPPGSGDGANGPPEATGHGSGRSAVTWVLGGVGVAGLAVGTIFTLNASSAWSHAKDECGGSCTASSNPQAFNDRNSAVTDATVATVAFGAGGAALAAALIVWLTAPKSGAASPGTAVVVPMIAPDVAGIGAAGRF